MSRYTIRRELTDAEQAPLQAYSPLLQKLLFHRNVTTTEAAQEYFALDYEHGLHDPFLLPNMKEAVARIVAAINANEHVVIYADYDADGIPGSVVLYDFFRMIGYEHISVYIPHRNKEGFGLNIKAIDSLHEQGAQLLITVDCGTADVAEIAYAQELGIEVIVTDHHKENEQLPDAIIVNHKLSTSTYPEQVLCGSGVVFKLVQALVQQPQFELTPGKEKWLLDMVGIATLSDMVPLTGENRILAHYGMLVLRKTPRKGIIHLLKKAGTNQSTITETDIGFTISPRINAASRMGKPMDAFTLLTADTDTIASEAIKKLESLNNERKGHVASLVKKAKQKIITTKQDTSRVVVVGDPSWQPSLVGLVANVLAEEYSCPAFVWGRGDGSELKGSCRTGNGIGVHSLLQHASAMFDAAGGHDEAGGFVLKRDKVDLVHEALHEAAAHSAEDTTAKPCYVDAVVPLREASAIFKETRSLAPFGMANEEPVFQFDAVTIRDVAIFGKQKNHLKCTCVADDGATIEVMAFFTLPTTFTPPLQNGDVRTVIGTLQESQWGYRKTVQLRLLEVL